MINPSGFRLGAGQELKVEELQEGLFTVSNAYDGEYEYFARPRAINESEDSSLDENTGFHTWIERVYRQFRNWDVQQVLANAIALLKTSGTVLIGLRLAKSHHAYPRHKVLGKPDTPAELTESHLLAAINEYQAKTGRDLDDIRAEIDEQIDNFLETSTILGPSRKASISNEEILKTRPGLRALMNEVRQQYPVLNGSEMLHEDVLGEIFAKEGIKVFQVEKLPLLSLFLDYTDAAGRPQKAVVLKKGIHQALRDFLLAHEMGHWFLHVRTGFAENQMGRNFYLHSSPEWMPLEAAADAFAMAALFPAAYLADCEIAEGELTAERLFQRFTAHIKEPVHEELSETMLTYIDKRIKRYKDFRDLTNPLRILMSSIKEKNIEPLLEILGGTDARVRWVRMDENSLIIEASHNFVELFGVPEDAIVGKLKPKDLVVPGDREHMQERAEIRMRRLEPICYYTFIQHPDQTISRQVVVYSFPIVRDGGEYAGAIGILIPLDEVDLEPQQPLDEKSLA